MLRTKPSSGWCGKQQAVVCPPFPPPPASRGTVIPCTPADSVHNLGLRPNAGRPTEGRCGHQGCGPCSHLSLLTWAWARCSLCSLTWWASLSSSPTPASSIPLWEEGPCLVRCALAFGERPPEMPLARRAGLWPGRGRGGWAVSTGKPGLIFFYLKPAGAAHCPQGKDSLGSLVLPVSPASASVLTLGSSLMDPLSIPCSTFQFLSQP